MNYIECWWEYIPGVKGGMGVIQSILSGTPLNNQ